ncbi:MAG: cytochrome C oxidase assembly protein [Rhodobacteraceae bacterium]|nr:cytochrome C oxidase assembly protein [Paracoccaceae bacterium]
MSGIHKVHELHTRRKGRNASLGIVLALFVGLIFAVTMVKLSKPQSVDTKAPNYSIDAVTE